MNETIQNKDSQRWECQHCGSKVAARYVKVFAPPELEAQREVRTCPNCTPQRDGNDVRAARGRGASYQQGEVADVHE